MARPKNQVDSESLKLATTEAVCRELDRLVKTGFFGKTRMEVAEELMRRALIEALKDPWVQRKLER